MPEDFNEGARKALGTTLLFEYRTKNSQLLYSMSGSFDRELGATDAVLCNAVLVAGSNYPVEKVNRKGAGARDTTQRSDGKSVVYKEFIEINWDKQVIRSTKGKDQTLLVLSVVLKELSDEAGVAAVEERVKKLEHGAN